MSTPYLDEKSVFNTARKIGDEAARESYLKLACSDDAEALERIRKLLKAHQEDRDFLDCPPTGAESRGYTSSISESTGSVIGPYKLLQEIGHGGMGVVYMAEQTEPVERRVALKIIKPGMDTRQVIARFEAERQALAIMDHPNIAKVLDAGTTDSGRPYFVMELVKGMPITQYCDENQLTPRERLELLLPVCRAVQHAHQKGVIHRDLKPSNVLVADYDDRAVPKVIDFGVAKAINHRLTEKTMFTELGQVVGTIEYMSPEQAKLNQLDIDTRSDIYSLGVLLYELLTGLTPFDRERLRNAAFDELLRIIREEEPPRPSVRLSASDALPSIATSRRIDPKKLSTFVRGELDWIVMKALEKDRTRRYETANSLAEDIQRYLDGEALTACPPSVTYRFRKFATRHKSMIATTVCIALVLVTGLIGTGWQAYVATQEANKRRNAEESLRLATEQRMAAEAAREEAEVQRRMALAAKMEAEKQRLMAEDQRQIAILEREKAEASRRQAVQAFEMAKLAKEAAQASEVKARWALEKSKERTETASPGSSADD